MKYFTRKRPSIVSDETGHKLELSDAAAHLADAIASADADALKKAAADHATALNSQATAMAASIAKPLYGKMDELVSAFHGARTADLDWRVEERNRRDAQSDYLYKELDEIKRLELDGQAETKKLAAQLGDVGQALRATITRVSNAEEAVSGHDITLAAHAARIAAQQKWIDQASPRLDFVDKEVRLLRRDFKVVMAHLTRDKEFLKRLTEGESGES